MASGSRGETAQRMAVAAGALVGALDDGQRAVAVWPFPSDPERSAWFYTPTDHGGLSLLTMSASQQQLALALLSTGLSEAAFNTVATIMGNEAILDRLEGWRLAKGHRRRDPLAYAVRIFGEPSAQGTWSWRFGGHHVSLHYTIVNGSVVAVTPCFLGVYPARSPLLGPHWLRPLAAVEDLARDLMHALPMPQQALAMVSGVPPTDVIGSNRPRLSDGDGPLPFKSTFRPSDLDEALIARYDAMQDAWNAGLGLESHHIEALRLRGEPIGAPVDGFSTSQREIFDALMNTYIGRMPDDLAAAEAERLASLGGLHFAWAGSIEPGMPHYYRVQGPRLIVEYDCAQNDANHIHSVWRDPLGDFGLDALTTHRLHDH